MKIAGCDFHPRWQQIAVFDTETGEISERKLLNGDGEAERFYRGLRCHHKPKGVAKVAAARKLAVRLYWMMRTQVAYPEIAHIESSSRVPLAGKQADELIERSRIRH